MLFGILDKFIFLSPPKKLEFFYLFTSLLSAIALTLIIFWFYREFGLSVSLFVLVSTIFSRWLVVFGRNLYWSIWAFYLPMIACMYFLEYERRTKELKKSLLGGLVFLGVFVKCLINGYEHLTAALIMMLVPFVYYKIRDKWNIRKSFKRIAIVTLSSCMAIFTVFIIQCYQIYLCTGNFKAGIRHIIYVLGKRTYGAPVNFDPAYRPSLESNIFSVVFTYLRGIFLDLNKCLPIDSRYLEVTYLHLVVLFSLATFFLVFYKKQGEEKEKRKKIIALIWATWFSALAPLSWYVIFKAHSFIHTHMNYVLWHMPFCIFGFALCGLSARELAFAFCVSGSKKK